MDFIPTAQRFSIYLVTYLLNSKYILLLGFRSCELTVIIEDEDQNKLSSSKILFSALALILALMTTTFKLGLYDTLNTFSVAIYTIAMLTLVLHMLTLVH